MCTSLLLPAALQRDIYTPCRGPCSPWMGHVLPKHPCRTPAKHLSGIAGPSPAVISSKWPPFLESHRPCRPQRYTQHNGIFQKTQGSQPFESSKNAAEGTTHNITPQPYMERAKKEQTHPQTRSQTNMQDNEKRLEKPRIYISAGLVV